MITHDENEILENPWFPFISWVGRLEFNCNLKNVISRWDSWWIYDMFQWWFRKSVFIHLLKWIPGKSWSMNIESNKKIRWEKYTARAFTSLCFSANILRDLFNKLIIDINLSFIPRQHLPWSKELIIFVSINHFLVSCWFLIFFHFIIQRA